MRDILRNQSEAAPRCVTAAGRAASRVSRRAHFMPSSPSLCAHFSVLTHHVAQDEELRGEDPDGGRLHGVGRSGERERRREEAESRCGGLARLGLAWVGSGRLSAQRSASGSSPSTPDLGGSARIGTDRIGAVRLARGAGCLLADAHSRCCHCGSGEGGLEGLRAAHCT